MTNPLITVIIPVYNAGKYFNDCIASITNQTYKNLEIIIVDDGSTDSTPAFCDTWAKKDERIKVIHKKNGGASSARNTGLDNANGDYIGFVDADDYIDSDMYEIMLAEILENNANCASCGIIRENKNGNNEDWGNDEFKILNSQQVLKLVGEANGILPVHSCNKLFSKQCVGNVRFNTKFKFAEDTLFNFQVAKNIDKMVVHNISRYHYNNNDSSITHKEFNDTYFDEHRVMDVIFSQSDEETLPYCIKGDVMKSFRTIRQMCSSGNHLDKFDEIRNRIIKNKKVIFTTSLYTKATKFKTAFLLLAPNLYKVFIKKYSDKKYNTKKEK